MASDETEQGSLPPSEASAVQAPPNWTEQDEQLRAFWLDHKTPEEIASALGRSVAAVMTRAARLGLPRRAAPGRKRGYRRADTGAPREKTVRVRVTRTSSSTEEEAWQQPREETKMRVCLMCLRKFESQGRHNRICPACKGSAEYATGNSTPDFTFEVSK